MLPSVPESVSTALANPLDITNFTNLQNYVRDHFVVSVSEKIWGDDYSTPWEWLKPAEIEEVFRHLMRIYQEVGGLLAPEAKRHALKVGPDTDTWIALLYAGQSQSEIFDRYDLDHSTAMCNHYNSREEKLAKWLGRVYWLWLGWGDPYELPPIPQVELDELES